MTNYLARTWTQTKGCLHCLEDNIDFDQLLVSFIHHSVLLGSNKREKGSAAVSSSFKPEIYPAVQISAFITTPTPFIEEFLRNLHQLNYPKSRIYLTLYCNVSSIHARRDVTAIDLSVSPLFFVGRRALSTSPGIQRYSRL